MPFAMGANAIARKREKSFRAASAAIRSPPWSRQGDASAFGEQAPADDESSAGDGGAWSSSGDSMASAEVLSDGTVRGFGSS